MKKLLLLALLVTMCDSVWSQSSKLQWQKSLGGSSGEQAAGIRQTTDGGYIINGSSLSTDGQVTGNHGGDDYWVVKLNDTGALQWEISLGGTQSDVGNAIQQTLDGGYIVGGGTESTDGNVTCSTTSGADYNYWLVKLTASGFIEWNNCFGSTNPTEFSMIRSLALTADTDFIVAGESDANDGEVTGNHGGWDYWVILVSSSGNLLWEKSLGGSGSDFAKSVAQCADGGYIVAGYSNSADDQVTGNHGDYDYWVVKLDDTGAIQWQKSLGGSSRENAYSVQQTFDGGYILAGSSNSNDGQVTGHHSDTTTSDFWVVKLDDTGAVQWQESLGGSGDDVAYAVQQTLDSGYIVSGTTASSDGDVTVNYGGQDYWVVKLNKYGAITWQKSLGGSMNDFQPYIQQTADSGYITAGSSSSNDGMVTGNHGSDDYWVVKLSSCFLDSPIIVKTDSLLSTTGTYYGYQWYYDGTPIPGATNSTYIATANGNYNLSISDTNSCKGVSNNVNATGLGVNNLFLSSVITIVPNPTTGFINVKGAGLENISVFNALGQLMTEQDKTDRVSLSDFPAGLYLVRLSNEQGEIIYRQTIVKQ